MTRPVKRATSADVARAAGVSQTTVSFVLNNTPGQTIPDDTRRRVLRAAERLGYRPHGPARALAAGHSDIVLLSIPDLPTSAAITRFTMELNAALARHGLILVAHLEGPHGRPLADVCAATDAAAVVGLGHFDPDTVRALRQAGADIVLPSDDDFPSGTGESGWMARIGGLQAEHLISRGHRRIGYAMPDHPGLRPMAEQRLGGVIAACPEPPTVLTVDLDADSTAQAVTRWTAASVTGICAFNDETAIAVLAGMRARGLTAPADLAVIGADDIPTAALAAPPLSTIGMELPLLGGRYADTIAAVLSGQRPRLAFTSVQPRVIQRSST